MANKDTIYSVNGPVVTVRNSDSFRMMEMVRVGKKGLIAEVISVSDEKTTIQVYEETTGLQVGEEIEGSGAPLSVVLGPGILGSTFDGIERPLTAIKKLYGPFIGTGMTLSSLDEEKQWQVSVIAKVGDIVKGGDIIATCPETHIITHKSMLPPNKNGTVIWVAQDGLHTVVEPIIRIRTEDGTEEEICLAQKWPIKTPRPIIKRDPIERPLITGQRVIDSLFPIAKGGAAAIPGGFGTGKTMLQHQLAKWSDADIVVYVGCGERGNEMTQVLNEFSELKDPKSGELMLERTVLIANTSNMPVAAREASIYTGVTLAEYYRDMGYDVAMMADSTSRWAEALREISGRLEEMPAEEGYPAYLPSKLASFYERAGTTQNLNQTAGSVTIIGAVSPPGSDFSEPVTQNTKRFVRDFLALDKALAYARHYPAINWNESYSEYYDDLDPYFVEHEGGNFPVYRKQILKILNEETRLQEIVKLIGGDILPDNQKLTMEIARVIRNGFLQQNAFHAEDTYTPLDKQKDMMEVILHLNDKAAQLVSEGVPMTDIEQTGLFNKLIRIKYDIPNNKLDLFAEYIKDIDEKCEALSKEHKTAIV